MTFNLAIWYIPAWTCVAGYAIEEDEVDKVMLSRAGLGEGGLKMARQSQFGGPDVTRDDAKRLSKSLGKVYEDMSRGTWVTLDRLALIAGCSVQGASARIRDLRKSQFGGHTIERRRMPGAPAGVWEYRLVR